MEWKPDKISGESGCTTAFKALRKKLSLNQREFAKQLGVKRQTLACWESGLRTPSNDMQVKIKRGTEKKYLHLLIWMI